MGVWGLKGVRGNRLFLAAFFLPVLIGLILASGLGSGSADGAGGTAKSGAVLPCNRKLSLTTIYRVDGRIHFEGVAGESLRGKTVRIYEVRTDQIVATTKVRGDGTWWASAETGRYRYTWLSKFVAEAGPAQSRWRRLGQAVGIRGREPAGSSSQLRARSKRARIQVRVSGGVTGRLVVGRQVGCSRYEVDDVFSLRTNRDGIATVNLPRPAAGGPYSIYRIRTDDGWRISPPIVVKSQMNP